MKKTGGSSSFWRGRGLEGMPWWWRNIKIGPGPKMCGDLKREEKVELRRKRDEMKRNRSRRRKCLALSIRRSPSHQRVSRSLAHSLEEVLSISVASSSSIDDGATQQEEECRTDIKSQYSFGTGMMLIMVIWGLFWWAEGCTYKATPMTNAETDRETHAKGGRSGGNAKKREQNNNFNGNSTANIILLAVELFANIPVIAFYSHCAFPFCRRRWYPLSQSCLAGATTEEGGRKRSWIFCIIKMGIRSHINLSLSQWNITLKSFSYFSYFLNMLSL